MIVIGANMRSREGEHKEQNKNQEEENAQRWLKEDRFLKRKSNS